MHSDPFWVDDISVLTNCFQIWPCQKSSFNEKYNALTRFVILYFLVVAYYRQQMYPIQLLVVLLLAIVIMHKSKLLPTPSSVPTDSSTTEHFVPSAECIKPTVTNPYMNQLIGDDLRMNVETCEDVTNADMDDLMTKHLPLDDWDIMKKANSQRQFYTVPCQSGTCDSVQFANFLYNNPYK